MDWLKKNIVWVMLGGVVLLFLLNLSLVLFIKDSTWRGTFGDQFGAVNALFSGLAFTGLYIQLFFNEETWNYKEMT